MGLSWIIWNKLGYTQVTKSALGPVNKSLMCSFRWDLSYRTEAFRLFWPKTVYIHTLYPFVSICMKCTSSILRKYWSRFKNTWFWRLCSSCHLLLLVFYYHLEGACHSNYEFLSLFLSSILNTSKRISFFPCIHLVLFQRQNTGFCLKYSSFRSKCQLMRADLNRTQRNLHLFPSFNSPYS